MLYGSETWPIRSEDLKRLEVFDHRCLRHISRIQWTDRISNVEVRKRVLGEGSNSLCRTLRLHRLRWLGHVLRMPSHRIPSRTLFAEPSANWRKARGGQRMTWQKDMKNVTKPLGQTGAIRLPGWGPRDSVNMWLCTLRDMAQNRTQWRECCRTLTESL